MAKQDASRAGEASVPPAPSSPERETLDATVASLSGLNVDQLRLQWRNHLGGIAPAHLPRWLLMRVLAYRIQAAALGDFDKAIVRRLREPRDKAFESGSFISVTQAFNTTTSMGRLTLSMLLSFARFEREITGERIRDKVAASKRKGIWMGGAVPLGYRVENRALHVVEDEAEFVRSLFRRYLEVGSAVRLKTALGLSRLKFGAVAGRAASESRPITAARARAPSERTVLSSM